MTAETLDYLDLVKDIGFPIVVAWFLITRGSAIAKQLADAHVGFIAALGKSQARLEEGQVAANDILLEQSKSLGYIHKLLTKAPAA